MSKILGDGDAGDALSIVARPTTLLTADKEPQGNGDGCILVIFILGDPLAVADFIDDVATRFPLPRRISWGFGQTAARPDSEMMTSAVAERWNERGLVRTARFLALVVLALLRGGVFLRFSVSALPLPVPTTTPGKFTRRRASCSRRSRS